MPIPIDYATLRIIWWLLLGVLLTGFAIMDGFDLGIGMLLHRVARSDTDRRIVINTIGPVWEGNQVWLILGGGAIFAAWPEIYAVTFSGFYFAMLLVLLALILRPVGFKYRSKIENPQWRAFWDFCLFVSGFVPSLIFGVAVGNVLQGVPFYYDDALRSFYTGSFFGLLNPFALLCGLLSVSMFVMHGGVFLAIKTEGDIQQQASRYAKKAALLNILLFAAGGIWLAKALPGYLYASLPAPQGFSNPLAKHVITKTGAFIANYHLRPQLTGVPFLGFAGCLLVSFYLSTRRYKLAWVASALGIAGIIGTVGISMFPFILPSSSHPDMSLTVWDASSSHLTLFIMLIATIIFIPLILAYTSWVYKVMGGKVTRQQIEQNASSVY